MMQPVSSAKSAPPEDVLEVEQLLDCLTAIVIRFDATGRVTAWNQAAEQTLGLTRSEVTGRPLAQLALPWTDGSVTSSLLAASHSDSQVRIDDVIYQRRDGTQGFLGLTATPLNAAKRQTSSVLVLGRDITDHRTRNRKQLQSQKLQAIGQLAAGIAHEINTPAQYVSDNLGFVGGAFRDFVPLLALLRSPEFADDPQGEARARVARLCDEIDAEYLLEEVPRALEQALQGMQRISAIVTAMRAIAPEGGDSHSPTDLNQVVRDVTTISSHEWSSEAELHLELEPSLPKVFCKRGDINQVVLNLVVNASDAIKHARSESNGPKGTLTLGTRIEEGRVALWVEDTGVGMAEELRERIFDPFFTTKPLGQGTGQGLSFVHAVVVDEHAGSIEVESAVGRGARFTIRLPLTAQ